MFLIKQEIERLTSLLKTREKAIDNMEDKIKQAMILFGVTKIEAQNILYFTIIKRVVHIKIKKF